MNIEPNQVWASKKNDDVQRIIIRVVEDETPRNIFYIEYWKDEDRIHKEGGCSIAQLKSWGNKVEDLVDKKLLNCALDFLVQDRFRCTQMMLNDLVSVIVDVENRKEIFGMIDRIEEMGPRKQF